MTSSLSSERCMSINQVKKDNRECFGQKNSKRKGKEERERERVYLGNCEASKPVHACVYLCVCVCACICVKSQ